MKKLFISCPMRGRTPEAITESFKKMHKIAEATVGEELEVIPTYLTDSEYNGKPIACLGESIKRMQDADYFVYVDEAYEYRGCEIERAVAEYYRIPAIRASIKLVTPDICKQEKTCRVSDG